MKALTAFGLVVVTTFAIGQRLETSIGGKSADKYHQSVRDPRTGLYLFSSGD